MITFRSQNGEDAVLNRIFRTMDRVNSPYSKKFLEIGVSLEVDAIGQEYIECNCGRLLQEGWLGAFLDEDDIYVNGELLKHHSSIYITRENFPDVLKDLHVPHDLGVLSIDIDGNDYWLWNALPAEYQPSVVIIEYNASIRVTPGLSIPYDPHFKHDGTTYFGANAAAMIDLAHSRGYILVTETQHVNLFFVLKNLLPSDTPEIDIHSLAGPILSLLKEDTSGRRYVRVRS